MKTVTRFNLEKLFLVNPSYRAAFDAGILDPRHAAMLDAGLYNQTPIIWDVDADPILACDLVARLLRGSGGCETYACKHPAIVGFIPRALFEYLAIADLTADQWAGRTHARYRGLTQTATLDLFCFFIAHPEYWPEYRARNGGYTMRALDPLLYEFNPCHVADYVTWYHDLDYVFHPLDRDVRSIRRHCYEHLHNPFISFDPSVMSIYEMGDLVWDIPTALAYFWCVAQFDDRHADHFFSLVNDPTIVPGNFGPGLGDLTFLDHFYNPSDTRDVLIGAYWYASWAQY